MRQGEEFKALSDLLTPDLSSTMFSVLDPSAPEGMRALTIEDNYRSVARLELSESVPSAVRGYFDATRMLWLHGWYYYPFYTWASLHAGICAEMGLKVRFSSSAPSLPRKKEHLDGMLYEAVNRGWLTAKGFTRVRERLDAQQEFRESLQYLGEDSLVPLQDSAAELRSIVLSQLSAFRKVRNMHAHAAGLIYVPSGHGFVALEFTRDLLLQLFPGSTASVTSA